MIGEDISYDTRNLFAPVILFYLITAKICSRKCRLATSGTNFIARVGLHVTQGAPMDLGPSKNVETARYL